MLHLCSLSDSWVGLFFSFLFARFGSISDGCNCPGRKKQAVSSGSGALTSSLSVSVCPTLSVDPVPSLPPPPRPPLFPHPLLLSFTSQPAALLRASRFRTHHSVHDISSLIFQFPEDSPSHPPRVLSEPLLDIPFLHSEACLFGLQ